MNKRKRKVEHAYVKEEVPERRMMLDRLESYRRSGCTLMLGGKACYPSTIVNACFREDRTYMPDYISDEENIIRGINYIRVR